MKSELETSLNTEGNIAELGGYFSEIKYFIDCLDNNEEPAMASAQSARNSLVIVINEIKSADSNKIIEIKNF